MLKITFMVREISTRRAGHRGGAHQKARGYPACCDAQAAYRRGAVHRRYGEEDGRAHQGARGVYSHVT